MLLLLGGPGAGKTAVLEHLEQRVNGTSPSALIRFSYSEEIRIRQTVTKIAFQLRRSYPHYGRLDFRRLDLVRYLINHSIDDQDRRRARRDVAQMLKATSTVGRNRAEAENIAEILTALGGAGDAAASASRSIIDGVSALSWRTKLWRRRALFKEIDSVAARDPQDFLVDLFHREAAGPLDQARVDQIFLDVFLADLNDAFARHWRALDRSLNCLVLLDNADAPSGRHFLSALVDARNGDETTGCDPMLVVATSRGWNPGGHPVPEGHPGSGPSSQPPAVKLDAWSAHRSTVRSSAAWYYPVQLRRLTESEVVELARSVGTVDPKLDGATVHRLAGGHPEASALALNAAVTATQAVPDASEIGLRWYLRGGPHPGGEEHVFQRLLNRFLHGVGDQSREDLVTCSAARNLSPALVAVALDSSDRTRLTDMASALSNAPWCTIPRLLRSQQSGSDETYELDPLVRRILHWHLERRPDSSPDSWEKIHSRLRADHADQDDQVGARYHSLALKEVTACAAYLSDRFRTAPGIPHLRDFATISAAPYVVSAELSDKAPRSLLDAVLRAARPAAETQPFARLLVALWISSDPLGDPADTLEQIIVTELKGLAQRCDHEHYFTYFSAAEQFPSRKSILPPQGGH